MWNLNFSKVFQSLWILLILTEVCQGLHCYYCSGQTYSDPNDCAHPTEEKTFTQECTQKNDYCEVKRVWIDGWTEKIERGCSSNCAGRNYIWSEDFKVYCCNDAHFCNSSPNRLPGISTILCISVTTLFMLLLR